jgi:Alpha/beta hydrolase family
VTSATYLLIHGAGDSGWYWHLVDRKLRERRHDVVVMDLPVDDDEAGLSEYADVVVEAIGGRWNLVVVAQSFGGYVAPIVCDRVPVSLLVLVAGMIPSPGESADEMFGNTGYTQAPQQDTGDRAVFYHDVPERLATEAIARGRRQSPTPGSGAVAADRVARRGHAVSPLPARSAVPAAVGASRRARPPGDHARRNRQRSLPRPQSAGRVDNASGDVLE